MNVGDKVELLPPWNNGREGVWTVVRVNPDGTVGLDIPGFDDPTYPGADFAPVNVKAV